MGGSLLARAWLAATLISVAACGGPAAPQGSGAPCFRATECAAGLVCIDRVCTADLTSVDRPAARPSDASAGAVADATGAEDHPSEAEPAVAESDAATP